MTGQGELDATASPLDELIGDLQRERARAGSPSYAEIAGRIEAARRLRGVDSFQARPSRSTVYDLFRVGRRRIDVELFLEVLAALGVEDPALTQWRERATAVSLRMSVADGPRADARTALPQVELPRLSGTGARLRPLGTRPALLVLVGCLLLNLLGNLLTNALPIELYLDMTGTAVAAVLVGPWPAAAVGVLTNLAEVHTTHNWHALWFGLANAAGALVWGYGVRRGLGRTLLRYLVLNVAVAFCVTVVASNVLLFAYDGYTGHASDSLVRALVDRGHSMVLSVWSTNLITSLQDKLLAGFVALIVAESVALRQSGHATRLPLGD